jgi:hypothetical protein
VSKVVNSIPALPCSVVVVVLGSSGQHDRRECAVGNDQREFLPLSASEGSVPLSGVGGQKQAVILIWQMNTLTCKQQKGSPKYYPIT